MPKIFVPPGCYVSIDIGKANNQVLDPCNCSAYNVMVNTPKPARSRQICEDNKLWNHLSNTCEPIASVVDFGICDRKEPWDRCLDASNADKKKIKRECIRDKHYNQTVADMFMDSRRLSHILPEDVQLANIQLALAGMVAGSVITIMLIAIILTFCGLPKLPAKVRTSIPKTKKKKKTQRPPNITEGDHVSVVYKDMDEDEDILNTGYKSMSTEAQTSTHILKSAVARKGPPPTPAILQVQVTSQQSSPSLQQPRRAPPCPPSRDVQSTTDIPKPLFPTRTKPARQGNTEN